jgi:hypothetical protein
VTEVNEVLHSRVGSRTVVGGDVVDIVGIQGRKSIGKGQGEPALHEFFQHRRHGGTSDWQDQGTDHAAQACKEELLLELGLGLGVEEEEAVVSSLGGAFGTSDETGHKGVAEIGDNAGQEATAAGTLSAVLSEEGTAARLSIENLLIDQLAECPADSTDTDTITGCELGFGRDDVTGVQVLLCDEL